VITILAHKLLLVLLTRWECPKLVWLDINYLILLRLLTLSHRKWVVVLLLDPLIAIFVLFDLKDRSIPHLNFRRIITIHGRSSFLLINIGGGQLWWRRLGDSKGLLWVFSCPVRNHKWTLMIVFLLVTTSQIVIYRDIVGRDVAWQMHPWRIKHIWRLLVERRWSHFIKKVLLRGIHRVHMVAIRRRRYVSRQLSSRQSSLTRRYLGRSVCKAANSLLSLKLILHFVV